jgi:starch phosphorylase
MLKEQKTSPADPEAVQVQLYAEPEKGRDPEIHPMIREEKVSNPARGHAFAVRIPAHRPASDYTPRIIPALDGAMVPIEANQILWYQ